MAIVICADNAPIFSVFSADGVSVLLLQLRGARPHRVLAGHGESSRDARICSHGRRGSAARQELVQVSLVLWRRVLVHLSCSWLGAVGRLSDSFVSAYLTAGATVLVVHIDREEEAAKALCRDVHELYVKALLNPLYKPATAITSRTFRRSVVEKAASRLKMALAE
jgi:trafficking protein particle complex subunit 2